MNRLLCRASMGTLALFLALFSGCEPGAAQPNPDQGRSSASDSGAVEMQQCDGGEEVPLHSTCDSEPECADGSDALGCLEMPEPDCTMPAVGEPGVFVCLSDAAFQMDQGLVVRLSPTWAETEIELELPLIVASEGVGWFPIPLIPGVEPSTSFSGDVPFVVVSSDNVDLASGVLTIEPLAVPTESTSGTTMLQALEGERALIEAMIEGGSEKDLMLENVDLRVQIVTSAQNGPFELGTVEGDDVSVPVTLRPADLAILDRYYENVFESFPFETGSMSRWSVGLGVLQSVGLSVAAAGAVVGAVAIVAYTSVPVVIVTATTGLMVTGMTLFAASRLADQWPRISQSMAGMKDTVSNILKSSHQYVSSLLQTLGESQGQRDCMPDCSSDDDCQISPNDCPCGTMYCNDTLLCNGGCPEGSICAPYFLDSHRFLAAGCIDPCSIPEFSESDSCQ